jgi:serine/threonine protein kinase
MGAVYRARQIKLDRLVALKILPPLTDRDPAFAARFTREACALARLGHPSIVGIHDFGEIDGLYYFIMEFVDGGNLRQLIQPGPLPPREAKRIAVQVCDALQYAHDQGIIHRDIKPENILVDKKGRVKIADFGLAKLLGLTTQALSLTASQQVVGTLHYMAPEQSERPLTVDHRADIYSLGVVFYEMLTGELPLGKFARPSEKAAVPEEIDKVVLRALEKDPDRRYDHVSEMKVAIESAEKSAGHNPGRGKWLRNALEPYGVVATAGALASLIIAIVGMKSFATITDSGMWAIAGMVAAPAGMAIGIAYIISKGRHPGSSDDMV